MKSDHRLHPVTLEDLLRLKRAERPPAEFWSQFDRELRTKQLAAIVEPRPWWAPLIRVGARVSRYQLPIGAAAALALAFVMVGEYRPATTDPLFVPGTAEPLAVQQTTAAADKPASLPPQATHASAEIASLAEAASASADTTLANTGSLLVSNESQASAPALAEIEPSPSARAVAANLAAAGFREPQVDKMLAHLAHLTETRSRVVEPLTQISRLGESRGRHLAAFNPSAASANVSDGAPRSSERISTRLSDDRLYDTGLRRLGVGGASAGGAGFKVNF